GLVAGIPIANRLLRKDPALVLRFVAVVGVVVAACFAVLAVTPYLAVVLLMNMVIAATAAVLSPGVYSVLSLALPPRVRSLGFAVSALWILPGLALYPLIGHIADTAGIRTALFGLSLPLVLAGFLLASAGRFVNEDIDRARTAARACAEAKLAEAALPALPRPGCPPPAPTPPAAAPPPPPFLAFDFRPPAANERQFHPAGAAPLSGVRLPPPSGKRTPVSPRRPVTAIGAKGWSTAVSVWDHPPDGGTGQKRRWRRAGWDS